MDPVFHTCYHFSTCGESLTTAVESSSLHRHLQTASLVSRQSFCYITGPSSRGEGALAYGIVSGHASIANWRLLFLVEGAPTIAMVFIAFFFMPDSPEQARFLNEEEIEFARAKAISQVGIEGSKRIGGASPKDVGAALIDIPNWLTAVCSYLMQPNIY